MTTATILPWPSGGLPRDDRQRRLQRPAPAGEIVEVVRLDRAFGQDEDALHQLSAWNDRVLRPLNTADVRLIGAKLGRDPFLRLAFRFPPLDQFHREPLSYSGTLKADCYVVPTYLVNGHGHSVGAEYAVVAYVYQMHPGNRIRQVRKAAGLTQAELAERTGFAQDRISNYENGRRPLRLAEMRVIARELRCSPADLLADDDNPERLSSREKALLEAFRASSDDAQHFLLASAQAVSDQADKQRTAA